MIETLRRLYNAVDRLFDHGALKQEVQTSRDLIESHPVTARNAFEVVWQAARQLDHNPHLKLIVGHEVNPDGTARRWEFFFDLPTRRAKLACDWSLTWDASKDGFGRGRLIITAQPFPPAESIYYQIVRDGKLLHRQLIGLWNQELRRSPKLPLRFKDSSDVMAEFLQQGLDPAEAEFSFGTVQRSTGRPGWMARTRDNHTFSTDFV